MAGLARVFIATSLDGFIAGPGDDLSWLPAPGSIPEGGDFGYSAFMAQVGALLMGRTTYDVVSGFGGEWPYGDKPVLVATHRPLTPRVPTVRAVQGTPVELLALARAAAGPAHDVYVDGGATIRALFEADLIDHAIVTVVPVVLGAGSPLFAGLSARRTLTLERAEALPGGLVQLSYRPVRTAG